MYISDAYTKKDNLPTGGQLNMEKGPFTYYDLLCCR